MEGGAEGTADAVDQADNHHGLLKPQQHAVDSRLGDAADQGRDHRRAGVLFQLVVAGFEEDGQGGGCNAEVAADGQGQDVVVAQGHHVVEGHRDESPVNAEDDHDRPQGSHQEAGNGRAEVDQAGDDGSQDVAH